MKIILEYDGATESIDQNYPLNLAKAIYDFVFKGYGDEELRVRVFKEVIEHLIVIQKYRLEDL